MKALGFGSLGVSRPWVCSLIRSSYSCLRSWNCCWASRKFSNCSAYCAYKFSIFVLKWLIFWLSQFTLFTLSFSWISNPVFIFSYSSRNYSLVSLIFAIASEKCSESDFWNSFVVTCKQSSNYFYITVLFKVFSIFVCFFSVKNWSFTSLSKLLTALFTAVSIR